MSGFGEAEAAAFDAAAAHAKAYRRGVAGRAGARAAELSRDAGAAFGGPVPETGLPADAVVEELAARAEGGLLGMVSPNFHGWVIGASHPAGVAADWLTAAWGQNGGVRRSDAGGGGGRGGGGGLGAGAARAAGGGRGRLRHRGDDGEFHRARGGAQRAAARGPAGTWRRRGCSGRRRCAVVVGGEVHSSVQLSAAAARLRRGAGACRGGGRARGGCGPDALAAVLAGLDGPVVVCLQAGNVCSGAFDPFARADRAGAGQGRLGACGRRLRALGAGGAAAARRWPPGWRAPTAGRRTRTSGCRCPTTAGSPSCATPGALSRAMSVTGELPAGGREPGAGGLLAGDVAAGARLRGLGGDEGAGAAGDRRDGRAALRGGAAYRRAAGGGAGARGAERGGAEPGGARLRRRAGG